MPKQILRQAPYLRRYARALTGSQDRGDALVHDAMRHLLEDPGELDPGVPLRLALFRALHGSYVAATTTEVTGPRCIHSFVGVPPFAGLEPTLGLTDC